MKVKAPFAAPAGLSVLAFGLLAYLRGRLWPRPAGAELRVTIGELARTFGRSRADISAAVREVAEAKVLTVDRPRGLGLVLRSTEALAPTLAGEVEGSALSAGALDPLLEGFRRGCPGACRVTTRRAAQGGEASSAAGGGRVLAAGRADAEPAKEASVPDG